MWENSAPVTQPRSDYDTMQPLLGLQIVLSLGC
jgi:hypothetical protein